jgi:hypothetical protein
MRTRVTEMFGIELPIFAFSHCRDVVAAVSRAGGMGVLGALYFTPEELELELKWIDEHVDGKPYGVDVVMPAAYEGADLGVDSPADLVAKLQAMIPEGHRAFVENLLARHGVPPLSGDAEPGRLLLGWTDATGRPQVETALRHPIALLANALGPPPRDIVEQAHAHGVKVAALASTPRHAIKQVEVGVDVVVAQGTEAGGHTGEISTMVLVPQVVDAVAPIPVLAAGPAPGGLGGLAPGQVRHRHAVLLEQPDQELPVLLGDGRDRVAALAGRGVDLGRHQDVHAVGAAADLAVDPGQLLLEALRGVGHGAQDAEPAGVGDGRDHVTAVAERE